ncbi:hypothetical protein SLS55_010187 [Diplodia seriata]|uniref:Fucose-specific lectin n=1 Tax=Diplodia seriata TaxID=420778 RepID=A0ABR3BZC9_9PEZI
MAASMGKQHYSSVPSDHYHQDYSTLEVDESANLPEVKPAPDRNQLPEAVNTTGKELAPATGIASNSKLAASNYTDASGVEHSQVYYQNASTLQIWMADWDSAAGSWSRSLVQASNNDTAVNPRNGTAIAAANYWTEAGDNTTDFRCLFIDDSLYVRFLWAANRSAAAGGWQLSSQQDGVMQAGANSSLAEYVPGCNVTQGCNSADFTLYESGTNNAMLFYPFGDGDGAVTGKLAVSGLTARKGSAMAVAPIPRVEARSVAYPRVGVYLVDDEGYLAEAYGGYDLDWEDTDLSTSVPVTVDEGGQIAAMSQYRLDDYNLQILITKADGGVKMAYMNGDSWGENNAVEGMEDVVALSPIAANQLGRVYAFEDAGNGTQLVEWTRVTGTIPRFERVGVVESG